MATKVDELEKVPSPRYLRRGRFNFLQIHQSLKFNKTEVMSMEVFILPILLGLIPAYIAKRKGRSFGLWWLYGAAVLIIAIPHSLLIKTDPDAIEKRLSAEGMKKCPHCGESIEQDSSICRFCGRSLVSESTVAQPTDAN
jgi:hypothetical protein